jgi:hypothetical protein
MFGRLTMVAMVVGLGMGFWATSAPVEAAWWNRVIMTRYPSDEWVYSITNGCQMWTNQSAAPLSGTLTDGFRSVTFQVEPGNFFQYCGKGISFSAGQGVRPWVK